MSPAARDEMPSRIATIVLAAGRSRRFGSPKQLAVLDGRPLLAHAIDKAIAVATGPVIVVLGAHRRQLMELCNGRPVSVVVNERWQSGMAGSICRGISAAASDESVAAALVIVADQPLVTAGDLTRLIGTWIASGTAAAAATFEGTIGTPAIFSRELFPALLALKGDRGARSVLAASRSVARVEMPSAAVDVDTPGDLDALI